MRLSFYLESDRTIGVASPCIFALSFDMLTCMAGEATVQLSQNTVLAHVTYLDSGGYSMCKVERYLLCSY